MLFHDKVVLAHEILKPYFDSNKKIGVACSFGKDSMVVLDICRRIKPDVLVFSLLADTEFEETLNFAEMIEKQWNLNLKNYHYRQSDLIVYHPEMCCNERKILAAEEAVQDLDIWISGVRNNEGSTRNHFKYVEEGEGLLKINPILEFSELDIWRYLATYQVPINMLYKEGYRSLGCKYCSSVEKNENEEERDGRWRGTIKQGGECGIHTSPLKHQPIKEIKN